MREIKTDIDEPLKEGKVSLRPQFMEDYIGQTELKNRISISIQAAKNRNDVLDHILLYGPPGLGKTTLAGVIANEMSAHIITTSGPAIEKPGELAAILNTLSPKDVLFIDEIHRLPKIVEEYLYSAMEDHSIDIIVGKGPESRTIRLELPAFTLIGATTRAGMISAPLRDRFGIIEHMKYYSIEELSAIITRTFTLSNLFIQKEVANIIAQRSRGTPRIAMRLSKRVRDFSQVLYNGVLNLDTVQEILSCMNIYHDGIDNTDIALLSVIQFQFSGGPVGLETLSASTGEDADTIKDFIEPFLIQQGFIMRTPKGRVISEKGQQILKVAKY